MDNLERNIGQLMGKLETHMAQETLTTAAIFQKLERLDAQLRDVEKIAQSNRGEVAKVAYIVTGVGTVGISLLVPWVKGKFGL